jgi:hypothetical protein
VEVGLRQRVWEWLRDTLQASGTTIFVSLWFILPLLALFWRPALPVFEMPEGPPRAVVYLQNIPEDDLYVDIVDEPTVDPVQQVDEAPAAPPPPPKDEPPPPEPQPQTAAPPPPAEPPPPDALVITDPAAAPPEEPPEELPEVPEDAVAALDDLLDDDDADSTQEAQLDEDPQSPLAKAKKRKAKKRKKQKSKKECQPDVPGVEALGDNQFIVERAIIDYYASHLMEAARLAHVVWAKDKEGETIGFKVVRITCGSVLHEAGFKNGDVILSVNNKSVKTIPRALLAYRDLRKKKKLKVSIERKNVGPMVLEYKLI